MRTLRLKGICLAGYTVLDNLSLYSVLMPCLSSFVSTENFALIGWSDGMRTMCTPFVAKSLLCIQGRLAQVWGKKKYKHCRPKSKSRTKIKKAVVRLRICCHFSAFCVEPVRPSSAVNVGNSITKAIHFHLEVACVQLKTQVALSKGQTRGGLHD